MEKTTSLSFGTILTILTWAGFLKREKHFLGMNVDMSHSLLRLPIAALLYFASTKKSSLAMTRMALLGVGAFYLALGAAGTIDKRVGGLLPSGLTKRDLIYHYVVGALAVWLGMRPGRMMKPLKSKE